MESGTVTITYCGTELKIAYEWSMDIGLDWEVHACKDGVTESPEDSEAHMLAEYSMYETDRHTGEITRLIKAAIKEKENV